MGFYCMIWIITIKFAEALETIRLKNPNVLSTSVGVTAEDSDAIKEELKK